MDKLLPLPKLLVTISTLACLLSLPSALASDARTTKDLASRNSYLKRLLETDHRYASIDLDSGQCQVYVTLPLHAQGLPATDLNLILGTFSPDPEAIQDLHQDIAATPKTGVTGAKHQEALIKATRSKAEDLLKGKAADNLELVDQFGLSTNSRAANAKPIAKGARSQRNAIFAAAQGDMQNALQACQAGHSLNAESVETKNNLACLALLAGRPDISETISAAVSDKASPVVSLNGLKITVLTCLLQSQSHVLAPTKADDIAAALKSLRPRLHGRLALQAGLTQVQLLDLSNRKKEAFIEACKVAEIYGDNAFAQRQAGSLALELKDNRSARAYLERAASLAPGDSTTQNLLIRLNGSAGNLDEAIKIATQNVHAHPESVEAHAVLGKLHLDNKEFLGARLQFERAFELAAKGPPDYSQESQIFAPYIRLLDIMNRFDEMVRVTQFWAKRFPDRATCRYNLAYALDKASKTDKDRGQIIKQYREAIRLQPDLKAAKYNLALILIKDKQTDQAGLVVQDLAKTAVSDSDQQDVAYLKSILLK